MNERMNLIPHPLLLHLPISSPWLWEISSSKVLEAGKWFRKVILKPDFLARRPSERYCLCGSHRLCWRRISALFQRCLSVKLREFAAHHVSFFCHSLWQLWKLLGVLQGKQVRQEGKQRHCLQRVLFRSFKKKRFLRLQSASHLESLSISLASCTPYVW